MRTLDETELQRVSGGWGIMPSPIIWSVNAPPPPGNLPTSVMPAPPPRPVPGPVPNPGVQPFPLSF